MTTPWRKTIRDFQRESMRTVLVIAAIAIGMVGFSTVLSTYAVLTREINQGYLASNPASATLETDAVDDALVSAVLSDHQISEAEARRALHGSIKTGPVQWHDLTLFVIKDYGNIRISKLTPDHGAWPPKTGEMLIERDAFHVAGLQIGDTATIRIGQSKEQSLRVSGRVHDVGPAQARMENTVYGYITLDTLSQLGEQPYLNELKILVAENRFDEKHVRDVTAHVKKLVEGRGHPVRGVDVPRPGKHPHADLMDGFLLAMASFGLFVLAMSGVLVVNLLMAIMAAQVRQIGVMKAIGGTRGQIACIYFAQALLLGIAATALALPLGMLASRALCRPFGKFLNFDITSFAVPFWVYGLAFAVGIVMPLLAAAWPIWEGSAISVREGLAAWGVSQNAFGVGIFDRALARIGGSLRPLLLSIRNSFRRRTRLVLTMLTLAVSGLFFMSALNIRSSMSNTLDRSFALGKYDLQIFLGDMYPSEQIERAIRKTPGVVRAESWFTSGVSIPAKDAREGDDSLDTLSFPIIALPEYSKAMDLEIVEGRNLLPGDVDALVINTTLAEESQIRAGNTITLRFKRGLTSWHVVGSRVMGFAPASPPNSTDGAMAEAEDAEQPVASPDGRLLAFIREVKGRNSLWIRQMSAPVAGTIGERQIADSLYDVREAVFFPDHRIAFSSRREGRFRLYEVDPVSEAVQEMGVPTCSARYPAISPDGERLAFSCGQRGAWQIHVMNLRTREQVQLPKTEQFRHPCLDA